MSLCSFLLLTLLRKTHGLHHVHMAFTHCCPHLKSHINNMVYTDTQTPRGVRQALVSVYQPFCLLQTVVLFAFLPLCLLSLSLCLVFYSYSRTQMLSGCLSGLRISVEHLLRTCHTNDCAPVCHSQSSVMMKRKKRERFQHLLSWFLSICYACV